MRNEAAARVTVVGGTGFIGHHVTRCLVDAGAEVTAIHRGYTPARVPGARNLEADRADTPALTAALAAARPTAVVDLTAYTARDMEGLLTALPASLRRLIVISSGDVYWTYSAFLGDGPSRPPAAPVDEDAPLRERLYPYRPRAGGPADRLYGYEKIVVERMARDGAPVPVTVLRLPMVYGPGDSQKRIARYLERLQQSGDRLRLNPAEAAWTCTRGYVEDVARAIQLAALDERAAGETFNVGEPDAPTELEWIRMIATAAGWAGEVLSDPATPPSLPVQWQMPLVVDTSRIRRVLDYREPVGAREGLRRTVAAR
jgi:nucleoside-diphosphate-sugar epimerase